MTYRTNQHAPDAIIRPTDVDFMGAVDEGDYRDFIDAQACVPVYFTLEFRDFLQSVVHGTPHYLIARNGDSIVGVLPAFASQNPGIGNIINSLPWYGSHGGCMLRDAGDSLVRHKLLSVLSEFILHPDTLASTVITTPHESASHHSAYTNCLPVRTIDQRIGQISHFKEYEADAEEMLFRQIGQKTRNLIRKSLKQGFVEVVSDDDWAWEFLYTTHAENMSAIGGKPKPKSHFLAIRRCIPASWRRLSIAVIDELPVAALLVLIYKHNVEYLTPAIRHEYRSQQPLSFLIWRAMIDAVRIGARIWNWGGTWKSQTSLHHFKAGWGAKDRPYNYFTCATDEGFARLLNERESLSDKFPYYYVYPYSELTQI